MGLRQWPAGNMRGSEFRFLTLIKTRNAWLCVCGTSQLAGWREDSGGMLAIHPSWNSCRLRRSPLLKKKWRVIWEDTKVTFAPTHSYAYVCVCTHLDGCTYIHRYLPIPQHTHTHTVSFTFQQGTGSFRFSQFSYMVDSISYVKV